jgi:hypothetical protein
VVCVVCEGKCVWCVCVWEVDPFLSILFLEAPSGILQKYSTGSFYSASIQIIFPITNLKVNLPVTVCPT